MDTAIELVRPLGSADRAVADSKESAVVTVAYLSDLHIELLGDRGIDINKLVP
jgi:hypothetical protein